jgi:putative ABC transport system substrate-binding protein
VFTFRYHAEVGSYGVDALDLVPCAADYVDRIMRGANPGELPVQAPTKFELVNQPPYCEGAWPLVRADKAVE